MGLRSIGHMPWASRWMVAFGVLSLICSLVGWTTGDTGIRSGLAVGLAMLAAGAAAAQGRRSLRKTGAFVGMFLPVLATAFWGWRGVDHYKTFTDRAQPLQLTLLAIMALGGLLTVLLLIVHRSTDNIAERGYSINPVTSSPSASSSDNVNQQ